MLRFFFYRKSPIVKILFCGDLFLTLLFLYRGAFSLFTPFQKTLALLWMLQIFYALFVTVYPWYPSEAKGPGICLQFEKALVPTIYLWCVFLSLIWAHPSTVLLLVANLFLAPMSSVACILIYFYRKDPERLEVNLLSGQHSP